MSSMKFFPKLQFKAIADNTNEKEKQRKLDDQQKWKEYFATYVVDYFEEHTFQNLAKEFDSVKDQLDIFIPTYGNFVCGERNPGKRKKKKKNNVQNQDGGSTSGETQRGCGKTWNSFLTLTKFVCLIEKEEIIVEVREYGQRCSRCRTALYENPSFSGAIQQHIILGLLFFMVQGLFDVTDYNIPVDWDIISGPKRYRRRRPLKPNNNTGTEDDTENKDQQKIETKGYHEASICEACDRGKGCGTARKIKKRKKKNKEKKAKV